MDPLKIVDKVADYLDKADKALQKDKIDVANAYMALVDAATRVVSLPQISRSLIDRERERARLRKEAGLGPGRNFLDPDDPRSPIVEDEG